MENRKSSTGHLLSDTGGIRKELVGFIREEMGRAGFQKVVLGLSGGVDSAVVAYLATEAIGKENILAVFLPYKTSLTESRLDAELVIQRLDIRFEMLEISPMVDAYLEHTPDADRVRKGNLMARQRMIVLYDLSARENALVIGTSNKTEILLGYGTMFGDTACAINPIGDLYKSQVWQLAEALGVPRSIIEKKPTADLWPGQTDEAELGFEYRTVDQLLFQMIDKGIEKPALVKMGFDEAFISRVQQLIDRNQFKRRPPVIARVFSHQQSSGTL